MNPSRLQVTRHLLNYVRFINNINMVQGCASATYATLTIDAFTKEIIAKRKQRNNLLDISTQYFTDNKKDISRMNQQDLDNLFTDLLEKNKDKSIEELILECQNYRKYISWNLIKKLFKHYSVNGKTNIVITLQNYCAKVDPIIYKRNGEFLYYLAKAQCMKGNSEKGLITLKTCYVQYENLRNYCRIIFRELIQDSVLNRSEASLVIFKKHVLEFSREFSDNYPLMCFWHICWASTWFSDQMLANELIETSEVLLSIIGNEAEAFSVTALKDYNEDAVVRLLQMFLKYDMMMEYATVLQVLFNYKIKNRDIRGCTEIIRNCEILGITLPSDQQGRYLKMLIEGKPAPKPTTKISKNFKLKF